MTEEEKLCYQAFFNYDGIEYLEEYVIWLKIKGKAKRGFRQWYEDTKGNDMCGPWIPDLTKEESELLDRIYGKFHEGSYISSLSIGGGQVAYQIFDQIKHKVYH